MKSAKWMALAGVAVMGLATASSWGQADRDTKIIGSYVGAITQHHFTLDLLDSQVIAVSALYGFSLGYNYEGFHQGGLTTGSMFILGRRYPMTIRIIVPPFPSSDNRDIDFFMSATFSDLSITTWELQGTMPFGKFEEAYLRDVKVSYQELFAAGDGADVFATTGTSATLGAKNDDPMIIEAGRVSTQVFRTPTTSTRIKIRR